MGIIEHQKFHLDQVANNGAGVLLRRAGRGKDGGRHYLAREGRVVDEDATTSDIKGKEIKDGFGGAGWGGGISKRAVG